MCGFFLAASSRMILTVVTTFLNLACSRSSASWKCFFAYDFHSRAFQEAWRHSAWRCLETVAATELELCRMFNVYLFYRNFNDLTLEFCLRALCVFHLRSHCAMLGAFWGGVSVESPWLLCLYLSSATCLLLPVSALRSTTKPSVHYPACRNYIINKAANNPHASPVSHPEIRPPIQICFLSPTQPLI